MPEPNKRVAVHGVKAAEVEFDAYARSRVLAEKSTGDLERDVRELERQAQDIEREATRGK